MLGLVTRALPPSSRWVLPLLADLVCVLVFAFAGKSSHEATDSDLVVLTIVWPFALAVVLAHAALLVRGRSASRLWPEGVAVLAVTYLLGMALRAASGRGTAAAFLVVAALFLTVTMLGWRLVAGWLGARRGTVRTG